MPKFELLPLVTAQTQSATGKRALIIREYMGYIEQLRAGQAGSLQPNAGETLTAVRRRLTAASKLASKPIVSRRAEDRVYFWLAQDGVARRTRKRRSRS